MILNHPSWLLFLSSLNDAGKKAYKYKQYIIGVAGVLAYHARESEVVSSRQLLSVLKARMNDKNQKFLAVLMEGILQAGGNVDVDAFLAGYPEYKKYL